MEEVELFVTYLGKDAMTVNQSALFETVTKMEALLDSSKINVYDHFFSVYFK